MFISVIRRSKWSRYWFYISLFCVVFAVVYEHFSFGVTSFYMITMPLIPLTASLFSLCLEWIGHQTPIRLFQDSTLALTLAFMANGIIEIYGTSNTFAQWFLIGSIILFILGVIGSVIHIRKQVW